MIFLNTLNVNVLATGILHICVFLNAKTYACIFSNYIKSASLKEPWDMQILKREMQSCVCGTHSDPDIHPPWIIIVFVFDSSNSLIRSCMGTVINTKMVLTSHTCLRVSDAKIGVYELWDPQPKYFERSLAQKEEIRLSVLPADPFKPESFIPVKEVIYSKKWIRNEISKLPQPDDDVAIIVMANEWNIEESSPLCVPHLSAPYDPRGFKGYYYGTGGKLETDPTVEVRVVGNVFVLPGKTCDKDTRMNGFSTNEKLCIQTKLTSPTATGGPLVLADDGKVDGTGFTSDKTVFVLGLASKIKSLENINIDTIYFSNIFPWIPYLEYYANQVGAEWCETPSVRLTEDERNTDFKNGRKRKYVWEVGPPIERDESLDCVCGLHNYENSAEQSRIVGGEEARAYEFPWIIFFVGTSINQLGEPYEGTFVCGGSIINDMMILTAAHCVVRTDRLMEHESNEWITENITIYYRLHDSNDNADPNRLSVSAKKVFFLRDYAVGQLLGLTDYDLALVVIDKPLHFSNAKKHGEAKPLDIRPICLPREGKPINVVGKNATVAGWGITGDSLNPDDWFLADKLQKLVKPILPLEECSKRSPSILRDTMLCAGFFNRSRDSSQGDSGGPLAIRSENGYWTQVGVVSFGQDNYDYETWDYSHTVALYANVQKFLKFIDYRSAKVGAKWCKSYV